jgi:site-specific recombinase XerD
MVPTHIEFQHSVSPSYIPHRLTEDSACDLSRADHHRTHALNRGIQRLREGDLPGTHHAEGYLHHKYRLNLRGSTLQGTISFLQSFLSFLSHRDTAHLETLTREDLEAFIEHLQDLGLKASTVSSRVKQVKAFVRFLIEEGVVHPQVLLKRLTVKVPEPLPRAIPPDELRSLLSVIEEVRDRAMIMVLLRTGMRIGELLATTVSDLQLKERKILIFEAEKNRLGRVVYFSDDARDALEAWLRKRDPQREYLFYARGKETMSYTTARTMFHRYLIKAGLDNKGYTLHSLRHTFATELLNAGMRLECLQVLLGHSSLVMTRRYARLSDKTREEEYFRAMEKIEKEETNAHYQLDRKLQTIFEEAQLLSSHREELPEHLETLRGVGRCPH